MTADELPWDATPFLPATGDRSIERLQEAAAECRACDLFQTATQTIFGQGPPAADVMFVGEQPGDSEDRAGHPFVGPAGRVLDEALAEVGIDRSRVYVTNAVKHFKWVARGKRRIHSKPNAREIRACRVTQSRGKPLEKTGIAPYVVATVHPASLLRAADADARLSETRAFVEDLRHVKRLIDA